MLRWRSRCRAGDDGDHDGASEMEITSTRWWWPYHITYIDCMWCLSFYASYLALIDGSIIRWSLTKLSRSVLPEYAPLPKFAVPRHHVMIGCDKLYVHLQRVQASFAHAEYSGWLDEPSMYRHGLRTQETERSSVNHIVDMINITMFTIENYSISRDDRTWFSWFGSCII